MSIVTLEKPVPKVAGSDWYYRVSELKESCDNRRRDAFQLQNESHKLRNNADITTFWGTHHTNSSIVDRQTELKQWKYLIEKYYADLVKEIKDMKNEKLQTEQTLEFLNLNFTVTNHCLSIRDERGGADLCYDIADIELKNEQHTLETLKKMLTEKCQIAWEQINKLEELRINVAEDLANKTKAIEMDTALLNMTKDSNNISLKPDPLRVPKDYNTYEMWLRKCNNLKTRIENELNGSKKIRETMYVPREKTKNDLKAQNDNTNFALRRRIYETERIKDELEWQKSNMQVDKEKFLKEIENLEIALDNKLNSKKLADTRCEEKLYRAGAERCLDRPTLQLHKEIAQLNATTQTLAEKLDQSKSMYNILTEQVTLIDEELKNKTHALGVDEKCLQYRSQLNDNY
ncbi:tektin-2 [Adelges cooleyi]|uniref:tektin-2 n=1 Tax=Adelges cooleyi TaxID=133065 RepID=UPI00217F9498|nr:tektin-2 [Adelges cooleyi]